MKIPNTYTSREAWLRAATNELRPHFASYGYGTKKSREVIRK